MNDDRSKLDFSALGLTEDQLIALIEGASLPAEQAARVRQVLAQNERVAELVAQLRADRDVLAELGREEMLVPTDLLDRVGAQVDAQLERELLVGAAQFVPPDHQVPMVVSKVRPISRGGVSGALAFIGRHSAQFGALAAGIILVGVGVLLVRPNGDAPATYNAPVLAGATDSSAGGQSVGTRMVGGPSEGDEPKYGGTKAPSDSAQVGSTQVAIADNAGTPGRPNSAQLNQNSLNQGHADASVHAQLPANANAPQIAPELAPAGAPEIAAVPPTSGAPSAPASPVATRAAEAQAAAPKASEERNTARARADEAAVKHESSAFAMTGQAAATGRLVLVVEARATPDQLISDRVDVLRSRIARQVTFRMHDEAIRAQVIAKVDGHAAWVRQRTELVAREPSSSPDAGSGSGQAPSVAGSESAKPASITSGNPAGNGLGNGGGRGPLDGVTAGAGVTDKVLRRQTYVAELVAEDRIIEEFADLLGKLSTDAKQPWKVTPVILPADQAIDLGGPSENAQSVLWWTQPVRSWGLHRGQVHVLFEAR